MHAHFIIVQSPIDVSKIALAAGPSEWNIQPSSEHPTLQQMDDWVSIASTSYVLITMALDGFTPLRGTQVRTAAKPVLITTRMAAHGRAWRWQRPWWFIPWAGRHFTLMSRRWLSAFETEEKRRELWRVTRANLLKNKHNFWAELAEV